MSNLPDVLRVLAALVVAAAIIVGAIILPTLLTPALPPLPTLAPTISSSTEVAATSTASATGLVALASPSGTATATATAGSASTVTVAAVGTSTPTATVTGAVVRRPTSTPRPSHTPTATATPLPTITPTPTREPTRDACADGSGYAWTLAAADPVLVPPAGAAVSEPQRELEATWAFTNSGVCVWPSLRFQFDPASQSPPPIASPRLATQSDATSLEIRPGERAKAVLRLAASEVPPGALNWVWKVTVVVEQPDGILTVPLGALKLVTDQAWVRLATATPRPIAVVTQLPTPTPTEPAPPPQPPRLVKPNPPVETQTFLGEETFSGYDAPIEFRWEQGGRALLADEYYVVSISHARGEEYRWAGKDTWYRPPPDGSLGWLIDLADQVGRLWWRVLVVRTNAPKEVGPPAPEDVIVARSGDSSFRWVKPGGPSSGGGKSPGGGID
jgi:hypothetical protein